RPALGLVFASNLAQAIVNPLVLILDFDLAGIIGGIASRRGMEAGDLVHQALAVVSGADRADGAIHTRAKGGNRIEGLPAQRIVTVAVYRAVLVGHREDLAQSVVRVVDLAARGRAGPWIGVRHVRQQVIG